MTAHAERRVLPYPPHRIFDLVADVERYPEFLPWCKATRVRTREPLDGDRERLVADLVAGYKGLHERYTSSVTLDRTALAIDVVAVDGPFESLNNTWRFEPAGEAACRVHFAIDFRFRSRILQAVALTALGKVLTRMTDAFEKRAHALYGSKDA